MTAGERERWERDGYLRLGQVMSDSELAGLQERMDDIMLGKVSYPCMYFQLDSSSGVYGDLRSDGASISFSGPGRCCRF